MGKLMAILSIPVLLSACFEKTEYEIVNEKQDNPFEIEKKYYLKDCIVKVNLLWEKGVPISEKYRVTETALERMLLAMGSGDFPLFSGGVTRDPSYIKVYYSDKCEDRVSLTHKLIQNYWLSDINDFPDFSIETNVEPGFDGAIPSGWWLDDWRSLVTTTGGSNTELAQDNCAGWTTDPFRFFQSVSVDDMARCLEAGADPKGRTGFDITPLHSAASGSENPVIIRMLLAAGADFNARDKDGYTPLHFAAIHNENPVIMRTLLAAGADPNAQVKYGWTPLHAAAANNNSPMVLRTLLEAGANLNTRDINGDNPLHAAMRSNENPAVPRILLAAGADFSARNEHGWTPLHVAAGKNKNPTVLRILLETGADLDARTKYGWTPLHAAAYSGAPAVIHALLEVGADPNARDKEGHTPLDYAKENEALSGTEAYRRLRKARYD